MQQEAMKDLDGQNYDISGEHKNLMLVICKTKAR
jgi:hypothetical protein